MPDPRPFHIGSEVVEAEEWPLTDHGVLIGRVVWFDSWKRPNGIGDDLYVQFGNVREWVQQARFVHASDGAPLGEWVPIKSDSCHPGTYRANPETETFDVVSLDIEHINAIIRGEVSQ